jgi:hypothetical protein
MSDRSLEFDQGMSCIVAIARRSLAISTEVGVIAHRTLVSVAYDVALLVGAKRAVTVDASVVLLDGAHMFKRSIDGCKAVACMLLASRDYTGRAEVEIRA